MNMYEEGLPETAVILPAFNRELEIGTIVLIAKQYADRVIVVNNGSSDQCSEVAEFAGAEVVQDFTGTNKNFSLKKGIKAAEGADILVTMDMDVCRDPKLIPKMIKPIKEGNFDLVAGTCISRHKRNHENVLLVKNKKTEESPVGFLVFSKECLKELDLSDVYLNSIRSIMSVCERKKIRLTI